MPASRRLAAILAADIADYSRLMGADEAGTARALHEHRAAADPLVAAHSGRIVKTTGDGVLVDGDDIFGDGVNIAARLESIAESGGICISEDAFRAVRGKIAAEFADIGEQNLKNIARPLRAPARKRRPSRLQRRRLACRCRTNHRSRCCPLPI
jgi:class 3 adenylate cyclase